MEGYWIFRYESGAVQGEGIAMLHDGELVGGDLDHVWTGTYEEDCGKLSARLRMKPAVSSVEEEVMAREKPIIFSLSGRCSEDFAAMQGFAEQSREQRIAVTMRRCRGAIRAIPCQPGGSKAA